MNDYDRLDIASIEDRDGVAWYDAPAPWRWFHKHRWQTRSNVIERCRCGASQFVDDPGWIPERKPRFR